MDKYLEPLFTYFASDPAGLIFTIPEIAYDNQHPMNSLLETSFNSIEPEAVEMIMEDKHFQFLNSGRNSADFEKQAKIEYLRRVFDEEILIRRWKELAQQSSKKRPYPYNHEALSDVLIDDDYLVSLNYFSKNYGPLRRQGYAFGVVPPVPSINSAYWFMELLRRPGIVENASVRLDPFLNRQENDFPYLEHRAWWYGLQMDWNRIVSLKQVEHKRAGPDEWTRSDILYTDLVWSPRGGEVHFICEEIPTENFIHIRGSRYFHAIYDIEKEAFSHIDGALRLFSADEWSVRKEAHVKDIGKIGTRIKLFKLEGNFSKEVFASLIPTFFVWNRDIQQYFKDMV